MLLCEADVTSKNREKKARFLENFQPNTHEAAFRFMLEKAAEMGLTPVGPS